MPQVWGAPVVGFFLDHPNYANKSATSYTAEMQYLYRMQNLTFGADGGLMPECGAAFPPEQRHYCVMSPHMMEFVRTPLFVFNSRCASPPPPPLRSICQHMTFSETNWRPILIPDALQL